ncbi:MAG: hypothetical protein AB1599_07575 [Planctomycetota bacterium]
MPNGKIHDNPISDIIIHGEHPYPEHIEKLVVELYKLNPVIFNALQWSPFDWKEGKYLKGAEALLRELIRNHGNPQNCAKLIEEYKANTKKLNQ